MLFSCITYMTGAHMEHKPPENLESDTDLQLFWRCHRKGFTMYPYLVSRYTFKAKNTAVRVRHKLRLTSSVLIHNISNINIENLSWMNVESL